MIDLIKMYAQQISAKLDSQTLVHFGTENFERWRFGTKLL